MRDGAREGKKKEEERRAFERGNLVKCIHTHTHTHHLPPNTTNTKDAQFSISLRRDSEFCILDETRPAGDLFSEQNTKQRAGWRRERERE